MTMAAGVRILGGWNRGFRASERRIFVSKGILFGTEINF